MCVGQGEWTILVSGVLYYNSTASIREGKVAE